MKPKSASFFIERHIMIEELPKLTTKQQTFVLRYCINGNNASEAYRYAYDCKNMSDEAVNVEACKLLKNPKIALWIKYAESNVKQVFQDEIKYSAKECFDEIENLKNIALESTDKHGNPNVSTALRAVELKGKLAGHFVDKHQVSGGGLAEVLDKLK